ncbi:MAG: biotin synthase BioB [Ruminococcus sp.]|nr:biotin synthase BioB [Ruminococcus sp.]
MDINKLTDEIIGGRRLDENDDLSFLLSAPLDELTKAADKLRRHFSGNKANLCSIINGKSGKCSENCKFCAQSARHHTGVEEYAFLDNDKILAECRHNEQRGVHRFAIVTAGRALTGKDFDKACDAFTVLKKKTKMGLCASMGLLSKEQLERLKGCGVTRYHCNIETSKRNFPNICTTHTFDEKLSCLARAKAVGLEICSGGIVGMGETWEDRTDMALTLSKLGVSSIPINALIPIKGTPFEDLPRLTENDILRIVALFRIIVPDADIRLAAGRLLLKNSGEAAFLSGANSAITGDMLTTSGNGIGEDIAMLESFGFDVRG